MRERCNYEGTCILLRRLGAGARFSAKEIAARLAAIGIAVSHRTVETWMQGTEPQGINITGLCIVLPGFAAAYMARAGYGVLPLVGNAIEPGDVLAEITKLSAEFSAAWRDLHLDPNERRQLVPQMRATAMTLLNGAAALERYAA